MAAPRKSPLDAKGEQALIAEMCDPNIADNPYNFVMFAFPWGQPGTTLADEPGPREWQKQELLAVAEYIANGRNLMANRKLPPIFRSAVAAGRGIGKSALTSWIILWMMSTRFGSTTIVTANNETQLKTKTWAELGRWHTLAVNGHWFERSAMSLKPAPWFEKALKHQMRIDSGYYYAQAQLWTEENPDAFAGAHNPLGELYLFDEASGIHESIWDVTVGVFTEKIIDRYWFAFGNPRRNTGAFFECFHKFRDIWRHRQIDGRTVEGTDRGIYDSIIRQYGAESYQAMVEVYGQFPPQGVRQFISRDVIDGAVQRELQPDQYAPLVMGVDPARFGDDDTVIRFRRGRDARSIPAVRMQKADDMAKVGMCVHLIEKYNPDAICVDAGNGTGVIDRLRELGYRVHEVWFGASSPEPEYANFRTYMWARMREWLGGGCIDGDEHLVADLAGPEYKFMGSSDKMTLESKEEMKKRGLASPDDGDALACTFAVKPARRDMSTARNAMGRNRVARDVDYSIFG